MTQRTNSNGFVIGRRYYPQGSVDPRLSPGSQVERAGVRGVILVNRGTRLLVAWADETKSEIDSLSVTLLG